MKIYNEIYDLVYQVNYGNNKEHEFDNLVKELDILVHQKLISKKESPKYYGDLYLFDYTDQCSFMAHWNKYTMLCRGLVISLKKKQIVCFPMCKFFNLGESFNTIDSVFEVITNPNNTVHINEKYDGSCILCFNYNMEWITITRGSWTSDQAKYAQNIVDFFPFTEFSNAGGIGNTFIFEAVYPENKIVVKYPWAGLVYLGRNQFNYSENRYNFLFEPINYRFDDSNPNYFSDVASTHYRTAKTFAFDPKDNILEKLTKLLDTKEITTEGFVISINGNYKIKMKSDEYCRIHKIVSNLRPLHVFDYIETHFEDFIEEMDYSGPGVNFQYGLIENVPEEYRQDLIDMYEILAKKFRELQGNHYQTVGFFLRTNSFSSIKDESERQNKKKFALYVQDKCKSDPSLISGILFELYTIAKKNFSDKLNIVLFPKAESIKTLRNIFKTLRPTGNVLDGYTPRNVLNRFDS